MSIFSTIGKIVTAPISAVPDAVKQAVDAYNAVSGAQQPAIGYYPPPPQQFAPLTYPAGTMGMDYYSAIAAYGGGGGASSSSSSDWMKYAAIAAAVLVVVLLFRRK